MPGETVPGFCFYLNVVSSTIYSGEISTAGTSTGQQCSPQSGHYLQVVTKRTKNLKKQEIPSLDDPISKLNHIGKETVKKLNELAASAAEACLHLPIPHELNR